MPNLPEDKLDSAVPCRLTFDSRLTSQQDRRTYSARFVRAGRVRQADGGQSSIDLLPEALSRAVEKGLFNGVVDFNSTRFRHRKASIYFKNSARKSQPGAVILIGRLIFVHNRQVYRVSRPGPLCGRGIPPGAQRVIGGRPQAEVFIVRVAAGRDPHQFCDKQALNWLLTINSDFAIKLLGGWFEFCWVKRS